MMCYRHEWMLLLGTRMEATAGRWVMIPIHGIFETHLLVRDLARSVAFYRDVLGLPLATEVPERRAAFVWVGGEGNAMLGLWETSAPIGMRLHFAFAVRAEDVLASVDALKAAGVAPLGFHGEPTDEPVVLGWMPAVAVYFRDPDGHSLEFIGMLPAPGRPERGVVRWSEWQRITGAATVPERARSIARRG
jgi:lactoylglutathione lyase